MHTLSVGFCLVLATAPGSASEPGLVFYASYDTGLDADVARGSAKAEVTGNRKQGAPPRLVAGVKGKAMRADRRGLMYDARDNLSPSRGTIALWFQPVDWDGSDARMHQLVGTQDTKKTHMILYRYMRSPENRAGIFGLFAFYIKTVDAQTGKRSLVIPTTRVSDGWKRGEWHHAAATWDRREARLYVDGALVGEAHGPLPVDPPAYFVVSGNSGGGSANRIDEFRIYDRALRLPEIAAMYKRGRRALVLREAGPRKPLPAPSELGKKLRVGSLFQRGLTRLLVRVDATHIPVADLSALRVDLRVRSSTKQNVATAYAVPIAETGVAQAVLEIDSLKPGTHRLLVRLRDAQRQTLATWAGDIKRPDAPWLGNTIGQSDKPVAPFTAVRVRGDRIAVWGKQYRLGDQLLLGQATVRPDPNAALHRSVRRFWHDAALLAEPIRLVGTFGTTLVRFDTAEVTPVHAHPTHATFQAVARQGDVTATSQLRFDDDSIITADLTLNFAKPTDVRDLRLEIPLRTRYCRWMNWTSLDGHRDASGSGAIPAGRGVVWKGVFHPLVWLGDDYRGFGYFCDTSRGWTGELCAPDRCQIRRSGEVTTIVLRLVPELEGRAKPWRTTISFIATPARPLPKKWRGTYIGANFKVRHVPYRTGCPLHLVYWWTTAFFEQKQSHFSSPRTDTLRLDAIGKAIAANRDEPISHVFYTYPNAYHHPVVRDFYSDWCHKSTEDLLSELSRGEDIPISTRVDWNSSVRDWWLDQMSKLADLGVDGIYCDDPYTHPSFNHRTGTAFVGADGKVRPNYGLYGLRQYFRRLRAMLNRKANHVHLFLHMSNQLTLPFQIYFDSFANGEHLNQRLKQHYIGKLSVDEIRAQYMGYQWGNIPVILPELGEGFRRNVELTEEMLSMFLPHDIIIWIAWCDPKTARAYVEVLQNQFQTWADDCSFLPYWEAQRIVSGQDEHLVASTYVRRDKLLMVVANWSHAPRAARLRIDWQALAGGQPMTRATVALDQGAAQLSGNVLSLTLPPRTVRLVTLTRP